jgi:hypothetical protein
MWDVLSASVIQAGRGLVDRIPARRRTRSNKLRGIQAGAACRRLPPGNESGGHGPGVARCQYSPRLASISAISVSSSAQVRPSTNAGSDAAG